MQKNFNFPALLLQLVLNLLLQGCCEPEPLTGLGKEKKILSWSSDFCVKEDFGELFSYLVFFVMGGWLNFGEKSLR